MGNLEQELGDGLNPDLLHIVWQQRQEERKADRVRVLLRMYALIGAFLALASIVFLVLDYFQEYFSDMQLIAATMGALGGFMALVAINYLTARNEEWNRTVSRQKAAEEAAFELVRAWGEVASAIAFHARSNEFEHDSINAVIASLLDEDQITTEEAKDLIIGRQMRNSVVHGHFQDFPPELIRFQSMIISDVANKISSSATARYLAD